MMLSVIHYYRGHHIVYLLYTEVTCKASCLEFEPLIMYKMCLKYAHTVNIALASDDAAYSQ